MLKYLKNTSGDVLRIPAIRKKFPIDYVWQIPYSEMDIVMTSLDVLTNVQNGKLQVGWSDTDFFTNAVEGEAFLTDTFIGINTVIETDNSITKIIPGVSTDSETGKKASELYLQILLVLRELYNDINNPLYVENFETILDKIISIQSDISSNASNISSLQTDVLVNTSNISTLQTDVSTNTANIGTLQSDVAVNASNITTLQSGVTANSDNISLLQSSVGVNTSDINSLQTLVSDNTADISTNTSSISTLQADVASNATNISTLQTNVTTNTSDITSLQTDVNDNSLNITSLQTSVASNTSDITTLQNNVSTNATNISSNTSDITTLQTNVSTNSADIASVQSDITILQSDLAANTTNISDLQDDVSANASAISALQQGSNTKRLLSRPKDILFYYGWLNSFNSEVNQWNNEKVAQDMAKYNIVVLGAGVANSSHGDYANTSVIIPRIKELNPNTLIFGYVTINQNLSQFQTQVDEWETLQIHGIFLDEAGYDYGNVSTNGRAAFNTKVDYVHSMIYANLAFANAWNMDHVIGTTNDVNYPNTTYNPSLVESNLTDKDWFLLESFAVNTLSYPTKYETHTDWKIRGDKAINHRDFYDINIAAVSVIDNTDTAALDLFEFAFTSALMYSLDAFGSSDVYYGAGTAKVVMWARPSIADMGQVWIPSPNVVADTTDADAYVRYTEFGRLFVDFTAGEQDSEILPN